MDAAGISQIIGAVTTLVIAATAGYVAFRAGRTIKEVKADVAEVKVVQLDTQATVADVQTKVNGMHSNSMAREAQLTGVITDGGGTVPADPNVEQLSKEVPSG